VDTLNPTGYSQVLEEIEGGAVVRRYTYGLDLVSQEQSSGVSFYGYDGHGSVRLLTDAAGVVTDTYEYDAFGNLSGRTGGTGNVYLYAGEQLEGSDLVALRSRWYLYSSGRFATLDVLPGRAAYPQTRHAYVYADADPINKVDPAGTQAIYVRAVAYSYLWPILTRPYAERSVLWAKACRNSRILAPFCPFDETPTTRFEIKTTYDFTFAVGPASLDPAFEIQFVKIRSQTKTASFMFLGAGGSYNVPVFPVTATFSLPGQWTEFNSSYPMLLRDFEGFGAVGSIQPTGLLGGGPSLGCITFGWDAKKAGVCGYSSPSQAVGLTPSAATFTWGMWSWLGQY
jgi:RHS repeat-associated protein